MYVRALALTVIGGEGVAVVGVRIERCAGGCSVECDDQGLKPGFVQTSNGIVSGAIGDWGREEQECITNAALVHTKRERQSEGGRERKKHRAREREKEREREREREREIERERERCLDTHVHVYIYIYNIYMYICIHEYHILV